ncbi:MAG: peptidylprolyl isomerase [Candidatus Nealsonbacteria bacterium]|nr:peptidylprolyl isomerase [Candidatus Nealsonbacteria bacterium]
MKFPGIGRKRRKHSRKHQSPGLRKRRLNGFEPLEQRQLLTVAPTLAVMDDVTVLGGAPLHIALDGYDGDGDALSYSVSVEGSSDLTTFIPEGNRSLRISVAPFTGFAGGDMVLEMFEGRAPNTTGRIIELAEQQYYDGLIFHRVMVDFMIQGGSSDGQGSAGSGVSFDDEFHVDLRHTSSRVVSMANSGDDSNDAQFFITGDPTRWLDFNHSVFGFLTDGDDVRDAIENAPAVDTRPTDDVVMESVTVEFDEENGVLMLSAPEGASGQADVTVTVSDGTETAQRTFHVTIEPDTEDDSAYLLPVDEIHTTADTPATITLTSIDVDGGADYDFAPTGDSPIELAIDNVTGELTITPTDGVTGVHNILVGVSGNNWASYDSQVLPVFIHPAAPSSVTLLPAFDTGTPGDGVTQLNNLPGATLTFQVDGLTDALPVTLYADGVEIGSGVASGGSVQIVTNATHTLVDGPHAITATQTLGQQEYTAGNHSGTVDLPSDPSAPLNIVVDATPPVFTSEPVPGASVGLLYIYDVQTDDENAGNDVQYELLTSPSGMVIDPATGQITWTPQPQDGTSQPVVVRATNLAGGSAEQSFTIDSSDPPVIDPVANQEVDEHDVLDLLVTATDTDLPLSFSLDATAPIGTAIEQISDTTARLTWLTREIHGGSVHPITVWVGDSKGVSASTTIQVTVNETIGGNDVPWLNPIEDVVVYAGAPLHVALQGSDGDAEPLSFSVSVDGDPNVAAVILDGNRSLRIDLAPHSELPDGDMVFELFEGRAPDTTARIIELAQQGFYDGLTFHEILGGDRIVGGDPAGDGTGGSGVAMDDEFHGDLQHTSSGLLGMVKTPQLTESGSPMFDGDDVGDSQFYVTSAQDGSAPSYRASDFHNTLLGFLTGGNDVHETITQVSVDLLGKPTEDVVMNSVTVFVDEANGTLVLSADAPGEALVTVTVSDGQGATDQKTFHVTVLADPHNANPYLLPVDSIHATGDDPASFQLSGTDVDMVENGDSLWFGAWARQDWFAAELNPELQIVIDSATGQGTVQALNGLAGVHGILVGVNASSVQQSFDYQAPGSDPLSWSSAERAAFDFQVIPLIITPGAPTAIELLSDTGASDTDRVTNLDNTQGQTLEFRVDGVAVGADVILFSDGEEIGRAVAETHSVVITTNGLVPLLDGVHELTARQEMLGQPLDVGNNTGGTVDLDGEESDVLLEITVDTVLPVFNSTPVIEATEGQPYTYVVQTDESASYGLANPPRGAHLDEATGAITWTPAPGQSPTQTITVSAFDAAGNEQQQTFDVQVASAGPIDYLTFPNHAAGGELEYPIQPMRNGWLAVEAAFTADLGIGVVSMSLFDEGDNLVSESYETDDGSRIDAFVAAEQTYKLVVYGVNPNVDFLIGNVLVDDGNELTFYGTEGDDTIQFIAGSPHQVRVNELLYDSIPPGVIDVVHFDGLGGDDRIEITGADTDETVFLAPGEAQVVGDGYELDVVHTETAIVRSMHGADELYVTGSDGDDELTVNGNYAKLIGEGYFLQGFAFDTVYVDALTGQHDTARLYDSPGDDTFISTPRYGHLQGDGFSYQADQFDEVRAYSTAGGFDVASLYDSPGDDTVVADAVQTVLTGDGFYTRAKTFDEVNIYATSGGFDVATLNDSAGNDFFAAGETSAELSGEEFLNRVTHFDVVQATASRGLDVADLYDSPGDDNYVATPTHARMIGDGFDNNAHDFDVTTGDASLGYDVAKVFDSPGDDLFIAEAAGGRIRGDGYVNHAIGFDQLHAYANNGGHDVAKLFDSPGDDTLKITPVQGVLRGVAASGTDLFYHRAKNFEEVHGYANEGGFDVADLHDSDGAGSFVGTPIQGKLTADGYVARAKHFDVVRAHGAAGGTPDDTAELTGSAGADTLVAAPGDVTLSGDTFEIQVLGYSSVLASGGAGEDSATMADSADDETLLAKPGNVRLASDSMDHRAVAFETVVVLADGGGRDVARLIDSPGDDLFIAHPTSARFTGDGFDNKAVRFEEAHGYAITDGVDEARLVDSTGDDVFTASSLQGVLKGPGFYNRAKKFEEVHAFKFNGGHDVAYLTGTDGDDTFESSHIQGKLYGPGYSSRAKFFDEVYADAGKGDNDHAELRGSMEDDLLSGLDDWIELSDVAATFLHKASGFDTVWASPIPVGEVQAGDANDANDVEDVNKAAIDFLLTLDDGWQEA